MVLRRHALIQRTEAKHKWILCVKAAVLCPILPETCGWCNGKESGVMTAPVFFLENPTDRGDWWATVHGVSKSLIQLSTTHLAGT